ncbi:MAG: hypothetical protein H7251_04710, partial [Acetobacteraceae bacterium]|nr:hypothetical protein [Acetobacteraceae bacterium]
MGQEPVKLYRANPFRIAGLVAGVMALGGAVWWGSASHRTPPIAQQAAVAVPASPVVAGASTVLPTTAATPSPAVAVPSFDIVRVNPQGNAVIAGRAAPGAEVSVQQNGQEIGRATADQQGQFVVLPATPIAAGAQELTLSARSGDQPAVSASAPVIVLVPALAIAQTAAPAPPLAAALVILTPL